MFLRCCFGLCRTTQAPRRLLGAPRRQLLTLATKRLARGGGSTWDLAERTRAHGGRIVQTTGDGILAVFPVPSHAVRCACALIDVSARIDLRSRVGIHAGEVEFRGDAVTGLSVHIAARVCALADPDEVLATRTVKDVLVGSGFDFTDRGTHTLKGVPDSWQLFSVRRP
jgi:class 3 adenylate cyclase